MDARTSVEGQTASTSTFRFALALAALATILTALPVLPAHAAEAAAPLAPAAALPPSGGGEYVLPGHEETLSVEERRQVQAQIEQNHAFLVSIGRVPSGAGGTTQPVLLDLPVRGVAGRTGPGFHGVSNFVDQDASYPNAIEDYSCGARTYDTGNGYNHPGTDYFLWPFPWHRMDAEAVEVVAAAPGFIVHKEDGHFDRSCGGSGGAWNVVAVEHEDGSVAWYGHLKSGSVTAKPIGAAVARGEVIGLVGSSGASTGPHLHFELRDLQGEVIDPYDGSCNSTSSESWWQEQPEYYDSTLNEIATHFAPPVFPGCPEPEQPNYRDRFEPGETAFFAAYYHDQLAGQPSTYTVRRPDGSVFASWTHEIPDPHYNASFFYWDLALPADAPRGAWRFEVEYLGAVTGHVFRVAIPIFEDGLESGDLSAWSASVG